MDKKPLGTAESTYLLPAGSRGSLLMQLWICVLGALPLNVFLSS